MDDPDHQGPAFVVGIAKFDRIDGTSENRAPQINLPVNEGVRRGLESGGRARSGRRARSIEGFLSQYRTSYGARYGRPERQQPKVHGSPPIRAPHSVEARAVA
jgi:hypothetical protein